MPKAYAVVTYPPVCLIPKSSSPMPSSRSRRSHLSALAFWLAAPQQLPVNKG